MKADKIRYFVKELKRRRVFRGLIVYGASTLILLESGDIIFYAFGVENVPLWYMILLGIGFLGSLWFSWVYDITPDGVFKTEPGKDHPVAIPQQKLKTYRLTTSISLLIIIVLLSLRFVDNATNRKFARIEKRIAVLPLSIDDLNPIEYPHFEFLGREITSCLHKVRDYSVYPWEYSRKYTRKDQDYSRMGDDLSASILVDWKPVDNEINTYLEVDLINVESEEVLWSNTYNIIDNWSGEEIIRCSRKISKQITRVLRTFLSLEERELIKEVPDSPQANMYASIGNAVTMDSRDLAYTGRGAADSVTNDYIDSASFEIAIQYYTKAINEDPNLAEAYANRAKARLWGMRINVFDRSVIHECINDIAKAFELDPELPEAHVALGFYEYFGNDQYLSAAASFEKAAELRPEDPEYLFYLSVIYRRLGNWVRVKSLTDKVFQFNPTTALFQTNLGLSYLYLRDFSKAVECHDRAIALIPDWIAPHLNKSDALMFQGAISDARKAIHQAESLTGMKLYRNLALLDFYGGQYDLAVENIKQASDSEFITYLESEGDVFLMKAAIFKYADSLELANEFYLKAVYFFSNQVLSDAGDYMAFSKLGLAYAGAGLKHEAIQNGQKALDLISLVNDALNYPNVHYNMLKIYALTEQDESALDMIKEHLNIPSPYTLEFFKLDPDLRHLFMAK